MKIFEANNDIFSPDLVIFSPGIRPVEPLKFTEPIKKEEVLAIPEEQKRDPILTIMQGMQNCSSNSLDYLRGMQNCCQSYNTSSSHTYSSSTCCPMPYASWNSRI